jgi:uncharacterized protein YgbK (DUF1537 family)
MNELRMTFYGDDFTGSTDALEALTLGGVPAALFLTPPTAEQLARDFPAIRAVGVAGTSRAMTPTQMDAALPSIFTALRDLGAPLCHYKVCSTFDSSPAVGNIGRALEIGQRIFAPPFIPVIVGTPTIRRYVAFGNLFATADAPNGDAVTYRVDRHPTMAHHPVTPMHESDLRRHLAQQTDQPIGLIDLLQLALGDEELDRLVAARRQHGDRALLFDTVTHAHLMRIGHLLLRELRQGALFALGSSGVEMALTAAWRATGVIAPPSAFPAPAAVAQIVVMAGSASPATAEQIDWAEQQGFAAIALDAAKLTEPTTRDALLASYCRQALAYIADGHSVILYSTRGPILGNQSATSGERLGQAQGKLLRQLLEQSPIRRVCIAGGDTCGRVVQQLGIAAMTVAAPLTPGAPLCLAHAPNTPFDGLELALKGGQVGGVDYFGRVRG